MDSETAKERIADTIDSLIPDGMIREKWLRGEALAMDMPYATLRRYHGSGNPRISDNECAAGAYLSMCKRWPGFHDRVMGEPAPPSDYQQSMTEIHDITARFADRTGVK